MIDREQAFNDVLNQVALELDIPPHKYKEAMERFDAIKRHLEDGDYPGSTPPPSIYLQGSFRLGTVVRPVKGGRECGFDLDIVCQVNRAKDGDAPVTLKDQVGAEVRSYAGPNGLRPPDNGRRCWSLNYAPDNEGIGFHVDILPCLPEATAGAQISRANGNQGSAAWQYTQTTIAITNRDDEFNPPEHDWRSSNPIGFAKWFSDICQPGYAHADNLRQKTLLFEAYGQRQNFPFRRAEDIPDALVRTPLQRAIQIMKRHRDVRFSSRRDEKHKPISMIITLLAARLYAGRASQYQTTRDVLRFIVDTLAQHAVLVDNRALLEDIGRMQLIRRVGDTWYIPNPVNPHNPGDPDDKGENFADRWHEDEHAKAKAFFQWVTWLRADLNSILSSNDFAGMKGTLTEAFGDPIATRAINRLGATASMMRTGAMVRAGPTALSRFSVPQRRQPQWPIRVGHNVTVSGRISHGNGWSSFSSDCAPLPKGRDLMFNATTTVPAPFEVYWQVVNTGAEATSCGQHALRGEILPAKTFGVGGLHQKEATAYTGMHWIECFIVKDGVLVARSGEFVVNIE